MGDPFAHYASKEKKLKQQNNRRIPKKEDPETGRTPWNVSSEFFTDRIWCDMSAVNKKYPPIAHTAVEK